MRRETIATAKTVDEAINIACKELNVEREKAGFEILDMPSKRLLGLLGASEAKVKVFVEETAEEKATEYLKKVLEKIGLPGVIIESREREDGVYLDMAGEGIGIIVGHRGETLDALQYLVTLVANRGEDEYKRIILDTGDYRKKREKTLEALAKRIAINAVKSRRTHSLEPMNPYERRIIHTAVHEVKGAASWSVGEEPNRRVVIGVENAAQKNAGDYRNQHNNNR